MLKEQKMVKVIHFGSMKFEKLGTIVQPRPSISNGQDKVETQFKGNSVSMANYGLTQTFNLESGLNQTVTPAPAYFFFKSSNIEVARVSDAGIVTLLVRVHLK
jgi:hypothetical protein